jgi:hypothetical protein
MPSPSSSLAAAPTFSPVIGPSTAGGTSLPVASGRSTYVGVWRSSAYDIGAPVASVSATPIQSSCDALSITAQPATWFAVSRGRRRHRHRLGPPGEPSSAGSYRFVR